MSTQTSTPTPSANTYYDSKYGRIVIFTGDNYPVFKQSCSFALRAADVWNIVQGEEPRPEGAQRIKDWEERARRACQLITSSISEGLYNSVTVYAGNPVAMWQALSANDRTLNRIYQQSLLEQFYQEKWNYTTETLRMYLNRLDTYRTQLADTPIVISEQMLLSRLL